MLGIVGILAVITVLGLSLLITRLATEALTLTGMSEEAAKFQARSAFTGIGFTTSEAEKVMNHPARRRVIMGLMLLRSAGIVTIVLSLILSFAGVESVQKLYRLSWLVGGVSLLWLIFSNKWVDQKVQKIMRKLLNRWTDLEVRDYAGLLQLPGEYQLNELEIEEGDWLAEKTLEECTLMEEGVTVLGIYRPNGNYVGVPEGSTQIHAGDVLVLYGRSGVMRELDKRQRGHSGDRAHHEAVADQERQQQNQQRQEREYERERAEES